MKIGIIITLLSQENKSHQKLITKFLNHTKDFHLCFVNNGANQNNLNYLSQFNTKQVSVVNIKNEKSYEQALRIGFRYITSNFSINILCFTPNKDLPKLSSLLEF